MAQTTYSDSPAVGFDGSPVDSGACDFVSAVAEAEIPFGRLVIRGSSAGGCKLPDVTGDVTGGNVLGIAVADTSLETADGASYGSYSSGARVKIMRLGRCRVKFESTTATGASVFVRFDGGGEGRFRHNADTANAVALPNAKCFLGASAGELGIVEINKLGA